MTGSSWQHDPNVSLSFSPHPQIPAPRTATNNSGKNIFLLLAWREISPRTRHTPKKRWGEVSKLNPDSSFAPLREAECDARHSLFSWAEAESLRHLTAKYCPLMPPPRSTIAAAFSPDGRSLASTHGDHTVKIIDCQTGSCLKVLSGHRRTPWVVRFHPLCSEILASGSLDHEVRLWDANTSDCIGSRNFYRPIASVAFHAKGELLAVASGHKLFMWHYNNRGDGSSPTMILKTRRSLRAVHFHPHGAPFLLTAEVNDIDSSDSSMTRATSLGYLQYPPPAVFLSNVHSNERLTSAAELPLMSFPCLLLPSYPRGDSRGDMQHNFGHSGSSGQLQSSLVALQPSHNSDEHNDGNLVPMETSPPAPSSSYRSTREDMINYFPNGPQNAIREPRLDAMEATQIQPVDMDSQMGFADSDPHMDDASNAVPKTSGDISIGTDSVEHVPLNNLMSCWDPACLELPFMQGWLMGQSQAGPLPLNGNTNENSSKFFELNPATWTPDPSAHNSQASAPPLVPLPIINNLSGALKRSSARRRFPHPRLVSSSDPREDSSFQSESHDRNNPQPIISRIQAELVTSLAAELPCTVKLRIWPYDVKDPCAVLNSDRCRLTIPHAVLCSEMGAHFSPCGRYLAVCVACILPHTEADPGVTMQINQEATGAATSPTRHPISAHQVIYELRIYSLEEATFGSVLVSRAIRAAHCLTSIQFSPTSEHILLAYGRRHSSLLKSIVIDGETSVPIYTILEVYRVSDMELVRVLPSAEDEVNVACFHPLPGCGLVYGTKEGKLRVLHYDGPLELNVTDKFCL